MGRIRTIKPEFPQSESMGRISRDARLLFILLWGLADDSGRARGSSRMLASLLFPYDDDAPKGIDAWLTELEVESCISRYTVGCDSYLEVLNWAKHQKIDKPSASKFPASPSPREDSPSPREKLPWIKDQGPRTKDQGSTPPTPQGGRPSKPAVEKPDDVSNEVWQEWVEFRRKGPGKGPVTAIVVKQTRAKAAEHGYTLDEAFADWMTQGYKGWFPKKGDRKKDSDDRFRQKFVPGMYGEGIQDI